MSHATKHDTTCGHCGRTWSSIETPTPAARCPYEYDHVYPDPIGTAYPYEIPLTRLGDDPAIMSIDFDAGCAFIRVRSIDGADDLAFADPTPAQLTAMIQALSVLRADVRREIAKREARKAKAR